MPEGPVSRIAFLPCKHIIWRSVVSCFQDSAHCSDDVQRKAYDDDVHIIENGANEHSYNNIVEAKSCISVRPPSKQSDKLDTTRSFFEDENYSKTWVTSSDAPCMGAGGNFRYGRLLKDDGSWYEGWLQNNRPHGRGKFIAANQSIYEGEWALDLKHGHGEYIFSDGYSYKGQFRNDDKHGDGIERWSDGSFFAGEFVNSRKHGHGTYVASTGEIIYKGQVRDNLINIYGQYVPPSSHKDIAIFEDACIRNCSSMNSVERTHSFQEGEWQSVEYLPRHDPASESCWLKIVTLDQSTDSVAV